MIIDDEYVFNNKLYDVSIRDLKATFFDILSSDDSSLSSEKKDEYNKKIATLKSNMSNILEFVKELDSFYDDKKNKISDKNNDVVSIDEVNNNVESVEENNNDYSDEVIPTTNEIEFNNVIDYPTPVEANNISKDEVNIDDISTAEHDEMMNLVKEAIENDKLDNIDYSEDSNDDTTDDVLSITKDNDDQVKVILVSDKQFNKLLSSRKIQKEVLNNLGIFNIETEEKHMEKVKTLISNEMNNEEESNESLTDKAIRLYKEGKTEEAKAIMDRINS